MGGHEKYASFNGKQKSCILLAKPSGARGGAPVVTEASADTKGRGGASGEHQPPAGDKPKGIYAPPGEFTRAHLANCVTTEPEKQTRQTDSLLLKEPSKGEGAQEMTGRAGRTDGRRRGCFAEGASIRKPWEGWGLVNARRN